MPLIQLTNGRWRVQIRRKGLPKFDKVFATREEAERAEQEQLDLVKRGFRPATLTLNELWSRYKDSLDFKQKAANTRRTELGRIQPVLDALGGYALEHLEASPGLIYDFIDKRAKYVSDRTGQALSSTSIRLEIAALSAVCLWAKKRRIIRENFVRFISRPGRAERKRRVAPVEQAALDDASDSDNAQIAEGARFIRLLRHLGCRPGELASLRCADVNLPTKTVVFRATKYRKEDRSVHVTDDAAECIAEQIHYINATAPRSPFLFPTERRGKSDAPPDERWGPFNYAWRIKLLRKAGVVGKDFHAHATRREYVSRAIEDGIPYSVIRKVTGHHSTAAIEIYDRGLSTSPEIRAAIDRHAGTVKDDEIRGRMELYGLSPEAVEDIIDRMHGRKKGVRTVYPVPLSIQATKRTDTEKG